MIRLIALAGASALALGISTSSLAQPPQGPQPYFVGNPLGMPINPAPNGAFEPISANVKVYGSVCSAESCSYDPARGVIVVPNRGVPRALQTNNAWISFVNHDGSVHTSRWLASSPPNSAPP